MHSRCLQDPAIGTLQLQLAASSMQGVPYLKSLDQMVAVLAEMNTWTKESLKETCISGLIKWLGMCIWMPLHFSQFRPGCSLLTTCVQKMLIASNGSQTKDPMDKSSHAIFCRVDERSHTTSPGWTKHPTRTWQGGQKIPYWFFTLDKTYHFR